MISVWVDELCLFLLDCYIASYLVDCWHAFRHACPTYRQSVLMEMKKQFPLFEQIETFTTKNGEHFEVKNYLHGKSVHIDGEDFYIMPDYTVYLHGSTFPVPDK